MTPLSDMIPTMTDPDLKALRLNAVRLSNGGSPVQMATAADIIPLIDAEAARRVLEKPTGAAAKKRAPAKKKEAPVTGHQTALPDKAA